MSKGIKRDFLYGVYMSEWYVLTFGRSVNDYYDLKSGEVLKVDEGRLEVILGESVCRQISNTRLWKDYGVSVCYKTERRDIDCKRHVRIDRVHYTVSLRVTRCGNVKILSANRPATIRQLRDTEIRSVMSEVEELQS